MKTVSVVHLIGRPFSMEYFKTFLNSYIHKNPNYPHDLVFLFNGLISNKSRKEFYEYARSVNVKFIGLVHQRSGLATDAYIWASRQLKTDYVLFLNSYSEILAHSWLLNYMKAVTQKDVGIVGAFCSRQSPYSQLMEECATGYDNSRKLTSNLGKWKHLFAKYFKYKKTFLPFPNSHVVTNAFIISVELMKGYPYNPSLGKDHEYRQECGKDGITAYVINKGFKTLLMDKYGQTFNQDEWHTSKTFWLENQQGLLVSFNRTRDYENGTDQERERLTYLAWGLKPNT